MTELFETNQCPEFPHFGAKYPDARCIDGYLWDLDSGDENGLTHGGDDPCLFCNTEEYIEYLEFNIGQQIKREDILQGIERLRERYGNHKEP